MKLRAEDSLVKASITLGPDVVIPEYNCQVLYV